jgi:predicted phosphodiesterase
VTRYLHARWDERIGGAVRRRVPDRSVGDGGRIAILSDAHGNRTALEAVAADVERMGADLVLAGGDMTQGGCSPDGVVDLVRKRGWPTVMGNSDALLLDIYDGLITLPSELAWAQPGAEWSLQRLGADRIDHLRSLPMAFRLALPGGRRLTLVHATTWSLEDIVMPGADDAPRERMLREAGTDVVVHGHIHSAYHRLLPQGLLISVGAVSGSNDADVRPAYTLLTVKDGGIALEVRRVEVDVAAQREAIRRSGMPDQDRVLRLVGRPGPWPVRSGAGEVSLDVDIMRKDPPS